MFNSISSLLENEAKYIRYIIKVFYYNRAVASSPAGPALAGPVLARTFENINDYCNL